MHDMVFIQILNSNLSPGIHVSHVLLFLLFIISFFTFMTAGRRPPVTLEKVLAFTTGSSIEPVLGFSIVPEIEFVAETSMFATASTCVNKLFLPLIGDRGEDVYFSHLDMSFANDFFGME